MIHGLRSPAPHSAPAAKSNESPGRIGVIDQARLREDDEEDDAVDPGAVRFGQREQVLVDLQDEIYRRMHQDIVTHGPRRPAEGAVQADTARPIQRPTQADTRTMRIAVTRPVPRASRAAS